MSCWCCWSSSWSTAPLLTVGVPVDLPQTQAPPINEPKEPLVITVNREGAHLHPGDRASRPIRWCRGCRRSPAATPTRVLYVRGDKAINYGRVLEVMSLVSAAGFRKVSLVAEAPKGAVAASRARRHASRLNGAGGQG